ncbi:MAG: lysozyme inhibitor LprI family protein [Variovorax sp.]|nr:lysozyme inhibitor LprI family protein [Variovorax sp.]
MRSVIFAATILCSVSAGAVPPRAAQSEYDIRVACGNESFSMAAVRECLDKKEAESKAHLKRAEANLLRAIAKWDIEPPYIAATKAKLAAARKSFAKYRDDHCAYAKSVGGTAIGNALEMRRAACVAELNNRRAEQLRISAADGQFK